MPYHKLDVYQKAYSLALEIHKLTLLYPELEQRELAGQLRRSSKSIAANIAEGMGKQASAKEVIRFVRMAIGSCDESRVWLEFSKDLGYINESSFEDFEKRYQEVGRMLRGIEKRYGSS
jgi:four helix bundle protein